MGRNARTVGDRIEELLAGLRAGRDKETAEELVRLLVEMYGGGLERVVALVRERDPGLLDRLAEDGLVASLLVLHDLHPLDVDARIQRALDGVRPYLGSHAGGVEYLGVDDAGVAQLRLEGSCHGCPSSTLTVRLAIEGAIQEAAPEITGVEVAGVTEPAPATQLLQVGMGPPPGWRVDPAPSATGQSTWSTLPDLGPPTRRPVRVVVEGVEVLLCSVRGTLYAYRDACAACGASLAESTVDTEVLSCAECGARFDVRLAGRGLDGSDRCLDPLPLLSDSQGVRVAVPRAVAS
ncbi:NifU family protein [Solihabitans fulvus]|uniref:NifU family protein n=1 Tax=Solihabitans fulvus TaxID=1892852 RepID=A0A5B2XKE2_9PSEU|nr:NifU family protein [Solihabitans fulvus]KAA2263401.1 NifU family protein [Solihabitans fulvus]